jgi:predicted regulator of Ras-like GTPase activity (Roadblock/LC7/MglB family)
MFGERLGALLEALDGDAALALVSTDGLVVESVVRSARGLRIPDLDMLAAELVALSASIAENHREFGGHAVHGLTLVTERFNLSLSKVAEGFLLLAATDTESSLGRIRFELRRAPLQLAAILG